MINIPELESKIIHREKRTKNIKPIAIEHDDRKAFTIFDSGKKNVSTITCITSYKSFSEQFPLVIPHCYLQILFRIQHLFETV